MNKPLIRRYLLWCFKTTKESFERIERKTTQLLVDEYLLKNLKKQRNTPLAHLKEFEKYIQNKRADELKLKFANAKSKAFHPEYLYLKNRLKATEEAITHFLGVKELREIKSLYEKEFTTRILQAREH